MTCCPASVSRPIPSPEEGRVLSSVSFPDEIGYFSKASRFWTDREFPGSRELRDRILKRLRELKSTDPEATWARLSLQLAG